jgi:hypothetical protein
MRIALVTCAAAVAVAAPAAQGRVPSLTERARGAERVVVGDVMAATPVWRVTEAGDRLIVTVLRIVARETLKGAVQSTVDVEVEGGTIDGLTLKVSDLPALAPGDRAVFYLRRAATGSLVPHLRGDGVVRLDRSDRLAGSGLTLNDVRAAAAEAQRPR